MCSSDLGGSGTAAYSTDGGVSWTAVSNTTFGTTSILGIAYGGGKFVAVGASGKAAYWPSLTVKLVFNTNGSVSWVKE